MKRGKKEISTGLQCNIYELQFCLLHIVHVLNTEVAELDFFGFP